MNCQVAMEHGYQEDNENHVCLKNMLWSAYFGANKVDIVWIVHGWKNSGETKWLTDMKNSYFKKYKKSNVKLIVAIVGWEVGASMEQKPWLKRNEESLTVKLVLKTLIFLKSTRWNTQIWI